MDPPPPPPSTSAATPTATATVPSAASNYADSIDSSPRSRTTDSYFDDPQPPPPAAFSSKLRLMCSYDGHILPRPHDKSLCYVGGETRIIVADRNASLSSLTSRLASTLLGGRPFLLKYQLPNEDLDSLVSVSTDDDLDNMIDEYDRINSSSSKPSRLRLFLFPLKPESSKSIGSVLENSVKSEDWFLDALNGGGLNRGFSDSAASVNCLLGLDDDTTTNNNNNNSTGGGSSGGEKKGQEIHSVPDSPMLENTSSFGSASSSPSLANLPPIRVHVDDGGGGGGVRGVLPDQKVMGVEEQFAQVSIGGGGLKHDEGFVAISSPPPLPVSIAVSGVPMAVGEYPNRVFSDDDRSDHGVPVGYRKPPPPQTQPQTLLPQSQQKPGGGSVGGGFDLPSPDSVSSDRSSSNAMNRQKPLIYQEPVVQIASGGGNRIGSSPVDPNINLSDLNSRVPTQPIQDSGYVLQPQFDPQQQRSQQPQQFIHAGSHYIHQPTGGVPISAYIPVYPQQQHPHHQHHPQFEQQYPMYYVPARQPQYHLPVQQSSVSEAGTPIPSSRSQTPPNPSMVPTSVSYNPNRNAPITNPEMAGPGMFRTTTTGTPQLVQVPSGQHPQQYVGYSQVHPSQSVVGNANYAYEFADSAHTQIYYTQPLAPTMPSQYQTMTGAVALPEASAQPPTDNIKQQFRTTQPI